MSDDDLLLVVVFPEIVGRIAFVFLENPVEIREVVEPAFESDLRNRIRRFVDQPPGSGADADVSSS